MAVIYVIESSLEKKSKDFSSKESKWPCRMTSNVKALTKQKGPKCKLGCSNVCLFFNFGILCFSRD